MCDVRGTPEWPRDETDRNRPPPSRHYQASMKAGIDSDQQERQVLNQRGRRTFPTSDSGTALPDALIGEMAYKHEPVLKPSNLRTTISLPLVYHNILTPMPGP